MKPLISVVMSVYNEAETYINASVKSILGQTRGDLEFIIILDNPQNKAALDVLKAFSEKDKRIILLINEKNLGLANSLNKGFVIARGEYLARMDADDVAHPDRLDAQYSLLEKSPEIMLAGCSMIYIDENGNELGANLAHEDHEVLFKFLSLGGTPCFHPTWFFRKSLLDKLKGYRDLPTSQDYDFLARIFNAGFKVSNVSRPLLYYRIHRGRIGSAGDFYQWRLTNYIKLAAEKKFLFEDDKFKHETIARVISSPKAMYFMHLLSLPLFKMAYTARADNKRFPARLIFYMANIISIHHIFAAAENLARERFLSGINGTRTGQRYYTDRFLKVRTF